MNQTHPTDRKYSGVRHPRAASGAQVSRSLGRHLAPAQVEDSGGRACCLCHVADCWCFFPGSAILLTTEAGPNCLGKHVTGPHGPGAQSTAGGCSACTAQWATSGCMEPVSTPAFTLVKKWWALPQSQGTTGPLVCL